MKTELHGTETAPSASVRMALLVCLAIIGLSACVYRDITHHSFVNFDDRAYILENPAVLGGISAENFRWAFGLNTGKYWHPVTWLSLMLDCQLGGSNSGVFLATNLTLHTISAVFLFLVLRSLTGALWRSAFVAALFAVHPINVESVAWVVERKNVLSAFFWMLAMLSYIRYVRSPSLASGLRQSREVNATSVFFYLLTLFFFALGLMSKPVVAVFPFAMLLVDYWPLGRAGTELAEGGIASFADIRQAHIRRIAALVWEKIPFFVLAVLAVLLAGRSIANFGGTVTAATVPMALRIENALVVYVKYVLKLVWSFDFSCLYPFPASVPVSHWVGAAIVLCVVTLFVILQMWKRPYLAVGWFWYFGGMLPTSGLMQGGLWPEMADRFAYLPLIGIFIVISWSFTELAGASVQRKLLLAALCVAWILCLAGLAHRQAGYWRDGLALFEHAAQVTPGSFFVQNNFGNSLFRAGREDEAISCYRKSLELNPGYALARNNLGVALRTKGELAGAVEQLRAALEINPDYADAHNNLGVALFKQGKTEEAIVFFRRALQLNPDATDVRRNLDMALAAADTR